ncbi:MAG: OmpP1/FadL family transporter [Opitutaceae bacterium]
MNNTSKYARLIGALTLGISTVDAAATRIAYIDAFATARGNAFTATADNPSAVFYNAAGLTQQEGTNVHGSAYLISLGYEADTTFGSDDMDDDFQTVPSFFASHKFEDSPFAIGFGLYAPFALGSDWGSDAAFTVDPRVPYEAELQYVKYHLVLAWQITETLSIAAGISYDDTDVDLKATALQFDGNDNTVGYSLSAMWQPSEEHSFGLNYQAETNVTFDGTTTFTGVGAFDSNADLVFPESIVFGYSYRPNEKWNIEFNLDWTNWDKVNDLTIDNLPIFLPPASYDLNWESAFIWELGVTRYFDDGWHVSGGYTYVENAVPDANFLPIVPDSDRHFLSIGVGRSYDNLSWQITYQQAFASDRAVSGNDLQVAPGVSAIDGNYDLDSQAISFSLSYLF